PAAVERLVPGDAIELLDAALPARDARPPAQWVQKAVGIVDDLLHRDPPGIGETLRQTVLVIGPESHEPPVLHRRDNPQSDSQTRQYVVCSGMRRSLRPLAANGKAHD